MDAQVYTFLISI